MGISCIKHIRVHISARYTPLAEMVACTELYGMIFIEHNYSTGSTELINLSVELHFNLVDLVLQNNVVTFRLIFALSLMKVDGLYFLQLVK